MPKFRERTPIIEAIQFYYLDGYEGPETCKLAQSLGLSRHGTSKLWEIHTYIGWRIAYHTYWIVTDFQGYKYVYRDEEFQAKYEPVEN